ncbi:PAS domain S-box protein [Natronorubrum halophilum]|uniref:PAS domain S-box protein n=1 Tax=Natronorubrum halophilum TaxID=1702106 RepID=UPI003743D8D0
MRIHPMNIPSFRGGSLERVTTRRTLLVVLGAVAIVFGIVSVLTGASDLGGATPGSTVFVPVLLGLAAHGGTGQEAAIEQLTTDLEAFVAAVSDARDADESESERADRIRNADVDFELDRDDDIGRLSEAVEELAKTVQERERQFTDRERELRATNERFRAIIEASPAALVAVDLEETVEQWNPAAERIFGWSADEIRGEPLPIVPPDRDDEAEPLLHRLESSEPITGVETERLTKDGSRVDVSLSKAPFRNAESDVVGVMAAFEDITERKEAERQLRERERRLRTQTSFTNDLLDAVDDVFYVIDEHGDVQRWNETLPAVSNYSDGEIGSMNAVEFFVEDDRALIEGAIDDALTDGLAKVNATVVTKDGESIPYEFVASRLEDPDGNAVVTGIGRDISERKERERQLSTLMSNVPGMVYRCRNEPDWPFDFVSEGCRELTGYEPETLENGDVSWFDDVVLEGDDELWETVQQAVAAREPFRVTFPIETADGERRWLSERGRGVFAEDDSIEGLEGVITDVTEQVESERRFERTTRLLEQSQRLANIGAWELDVRTEPFELHWTDEVAQIHGVSSGDDVELADALEFYHPADRPKIERALERAIESGEPYDLEVRIVSNDGEQRWVRTIGESVRAEHLDVGPETGRAKPADEIVKIHGSVQDITDRKERERELERYETIVQALDELVYTLDEEGNFRFLNDATHSIAGFDPEDLIGENVATMMRRDELETARNLIRELLRADEPSQTFEMALETADGDVIETENHMALLPTDDGEFTGTAGVIRDITDRKNRERDLERTTDLLERVQRMAKIGGWELDVRDEPPTETWSEELYRLYDLPRDVTPTLETTLERYHPDDRPAVRSGIEAAMATGTGYELEARLQPAAGDTRWVRVIGEPIYDDDTLVKYRGSVQDISDQKRRELALESLHETARGLLNAETESSVADRVVETAADLLDSVSASLYLLDAETNQFEPAASTSDFADHSGGAPSVAVGNADSVLWNTYVTGTQTVVDDAEIGAQSPLFGGGAPGGLLVPVGDHGVFVLVAPPATIDDETRQLVETLVATTEAALDRLESEASLRERDAELEAQNRRLRRQVQITEIIRGIDTSLIGAESRAEIERTVPERLVEADTVAFAWIGDIDPSGTTLEPRAWAGTDPEYLDTDSFDLEADAPEPSVRTARTETPTVVENTVEGLQREPWRTNALDAGYQSVVSVPISFEEYRYGVLSVYADEPDAFSDLERTVFSELGEGIANAINTTKTQEALHAETLVELTLRLETDDEILSRIATATGAHVTYEGLGTHSGPETVLFFETTGAPSADVRRVLDDLVSVTDSRLVTESDHGCLFEATIAGDVVASRLVRHGGSPRSIAADGERTEITVDVPTTTDVREFVGMLGDHYAGVELQSRRHVQRAMHTRQELVTSLFEDLTDRQLEVLRTAYLAGFFEWPRESTGEEVAEMLDVTQPTVNRHLRIGQQQLLKQLFENGMTSAVDD